MGLVVITCLRASSSSIFHFYIKYETTIVADLDTPLVVNTIHQLPTMQ